MNFLYCVTINLIETIKMIINIIALGFGTLLGMTIIFIPIYGVVDSGWSKHWLWSYLLYLILGVAIYTYYNPNC